ncbi:hypothetical protein E2C01_042221 [Portunus trituberculatus]|uniref:Uncharacterized protein n=1 Tax=Portunus trituberculatus TaxID=210409 RepID=A0A5B7FU69_PORTR|nr:hypothetical protein [Portunus trituberculatus]
MYLWCGLPSLKFERVNHWLTKALRMGGGEGPEVLCQDEALVWMLLRHSSDAQHEGSNEKRCTVGYCVSGTKNC